MLTFEEVVGKVYSHLKTQKKRAARYEDDGEVFCMYRTPGGLKCAVGCLISDEFYEEELEGKTCKSSPVLHALKLSGVPVGNSRLICFLNGAQIAHDENKNFPKILKSIEALGKMLLEEEEQLEKENKNGKQLPN